MKDKTALETPDGRYIVVRGRLWRKTNPHLTGEGRERLVSELMSARRAVTDAGEDEDRLRTARKAVDEAKVRLGERGPVWWADGAPDLNRAPGADDALCGEVCRSTCRPITGRFMVSIMSLRWPSVCVRCGHGCPDGRKCRKTEPSPSSERRRGYTQT